MPRAVVAILLGIICCAAPANGCPIPLEANRTSFSTWVHIGTDGPFRFLVDTGTTITVIDRTLATRIGVQPSGTIAAVSSTSGALEVQQAEVRDFRAGTVTVARAKVLIADLPHFANHGPLDGILGMSFFAGHSMLLDLRNRCIQLDVPPVAGNTLKAHEVVGRVAIETEGLNLILDSGSSFAVLTSSRARAFTVESGTAELTSAAGVSRTTAVIVPRLKLGRLTLRNVTAIVAPREDARVDGLLPITLFERVYIAAERDEVVLR